MRKTAIAAGGAALAIGIAGCSGSTTAGDPQALYSDSQKLAQAAASETSSAQSANVAMKISMGGMSVDADGAIRFAGEDTAMSMSMQMMGKTMEMRMVDQTVYVKRPSGMQSGSGSDKPWVKQSVDSGSGTMGQLGEQADPSKILEQIKKAGTITKKERTELNGEQVSHYWVDIDLSKAQDMAGAMPQDVPDDVLDKMQGVKMPVQLWLNSDKLPVKMSMDMSKMMTEMFEAMDTEMPQGEQGGQLAETMRKMFEDMSMTMTYSDWGTEVDVTAPPADKVTTAPQNSGSGMFPGMPN